MNFLLTMWLFTLKKKTENFNTVSIINEFKNLTELEQSIIKYINFECILALHQYWPRSASVDTCKL